MKPIHNSNTVPYWNLKREDFVLVKLHHKYFIKRKDKDIYLKPNGINSDITDLPGAAIDKEFGFDSPEQARQAWENHERLLETTVEPL